MRTTDAFRQSAVRVPPGRPVFKRAAAGSGKFQGRIASACMVASLSGCSAVDSVGWEWAGVVGFAMLIVWLIRFTRARKPDERDEDHGD